MFRWFAELSPEQRLAELESRVAFFHSLPLLDLEELIEQKKKMDRPKDRAALDLLEAVLEFRRKND